MTLRISSKLFTIAIIYNNSYSLTFVKFTDICSDNISPSYVLQSLQIMYVSTKRFLRVLWNWKLRESPLHIFSRDIYLKVAVR